MSLPRFISRIQDSVGPLFSGPSGIVSASQTQAVLATKRVRIEASPEIEQHPYHLAGLHLLTNLAARLYPRIEIRASPRVAQDCRSLVLSINPRCDVDVLEPTSASGSESVDGVVCWASPRSRPDACVVAPVGWDIVIDEPEAMQLRSTNVLTALAAATIASSELFRTVFADFLPRGRGAQSPARFNVLTCSNGSGGGHLPDLPSDIGLGRVHLVGAGAIGQAAVYALARVSATGILTVVDPEAVTESNLQRYILSTDADVGVSKCDLVERALATTRLEVVKCEAEWSVDATECAGAQVVCAAVDTAALRIALQASVPERLYNAWTQPEDIGWSRHEHFGVDPCLACLYWPTGQRPSYHEQVARALRQDPVRVLGYALHKVPVDTPLLAGQIPRIGGAEAPPASREWMVRTLLDDLARSLGVEASDLAIWRGKPISELYREGVCGGALIRSELTEVPVEMTVPLAHQSVFAGIMLASQLIFAARPELTAHRSPMVEARLDLLVGFPQLAPRPRQRTAACICEDPDFMAKYRQKWPFASAASAPN